MVSDQHNEHDASFIEFCDEEPVIAALEEPARWRILIVDDDESVHRSVAFALRDMLFLDRKLEFLDAYSAHEALGILRREPDIAAILLDVVMESEHAGLAVVKKIRDELGIADTRIILHTGQPGFAPEISAICDYDINDYRTKSELTRNHLCTCIAAALRAYRQIRRIDTSRHHLRRIIQTGSVSIGEVDEQKFSQGVLALFAGLLDVATIGFVAVHRSQDPVGKADVSLGTSHYAQWVGHDLGQAGLADAAGICLRAAQSGGMQWCALGAALKVSAQDGGYLLLFVEAQQSAAEWLDDTVIETFVGHLGSCLDNRLLLQRLNHDAHFDRLLGLPNRRYLSELLEARCAPRSEQALTLALIDIDDFGGFNEALGQAFGDALLKGLGARLRAGLPQVVTLARISADIFAVLGPNERVCPETLLPMFALPLSVLGEETMVSVSLGLTRLADVESEGGAAVLEAAFQALRAVKSQQRGQLGWYTPEMSRRTHERVTLLAGLRQALRSTGLFVVYQPQVALDDGRLIGLEALVRWRTEAGDFIGPDRFIPVAEQSGLICELGCFVLREALTVLTTLRESGLDAVRMAVNVSAVQFRDPDFLSELGDIIRSVGADSSKLELEITESVAMEDAAYVRASLDTIRQHGIQLAIDDFGTGYSSLAQLKQLSVDRLKIDRAFVKDLDEAAFEASIAGVIVQLGHKLGVEVIAEGVETPEQAALLRRMGCQEAQGYLFGRPMPLPDLLGWIRQHQAGRLH
jgi:diguanylate cyclase (GGDEF)-like protein